MSGRVILLGCAVVFQFLLELTMGRILVSPSIVALTLVYLTLGHGSDWAVDGAFWSGLSLDLLLHQPPGASSLALLAGLWTVRMLSRISAGEGGGNLLLMTAAAVMVSDAAFIILASKPFGSGFGSHLLLVFPRAALTVAFGGIAVALREGIVKLRPGRSHVP
jgi:hypothetical protein